MFKKKFRVVALLLAMAMVFGACASKEPASTTEEPKKEEAADTKEEAAETKEEETAETEEPQELVELNYMLFNAAGWEDRYTPSLESPMIKELEAKTGVRLTMTGTDEEKKQVIMAGGDTTDILEFATAADVQTAMEAGLLLPLNDLLEEYGQDILNNVPERLDMSKRLFSDEEGNVYALTSNAGPEGYSQRITDSTYLLRWDYYEEMNYPEMKNLDDLLNVLAEMQKAHPETEDGKPVYGIGFYISDNNTHNFQKRMWHDYGFRNSTNNILTKVEDHSMVFNFTDPEGPYWMACEFYNKAYRMGLLDPDSLTQQEADYSAKVANGQILAPWRNMWGLNFQNAMAETHPGENMGFMAPPVEGTIQWEDSNQAAGWEANYNAIAATCKDPAKAMEYLNFCYSEEGVRLINSGVEGIHWEYVDGEPVPTELGREIMMTGGDLRAEHGLAGYALMTIRGLGNTVVCEDGGFTNLFKSPAYYATLNNELDQAYCEHYGVTFPLEVVLNKVEEGKMATHRNLDLRIISAMGAAPEDIQRIDTKLEDIAVKAIPKAVMAASDAEFEAIMAEVIQELEAADAATSKEWWQARHDEVKAQFGIK